MNTFTTLLASGACAAVVGLIYASLRRPKNMYQPEEEQSTSAKIGDVDNLYQDDIIAVRKREPSEEQRIEPGSEETSSQGMTALYVIAETNHPYPGYDLLQILLSQGLRYGDMNVFHRHESLSGKGKKLFSLANIQEPGTFDVHSMSSQTFKGLTLFMPHSTDPILDGDVFAAMSKTALLISKSLGGKILDRSKQAMGEMELKQAKRSIINRHHEATSLA